MRRRLSGHFSPTRSPARARGHSCKQHWNQLGPKTTISLGDVRLVESLGAFCDAQSRDDIKDFFKAHKLPAASRALDQTIEQINNCIAMKEKESPAVATWLATR